MFAKMGVSFVTFLSITCHISLEPENNDVPRLGTRNCPVILYFSKLVMAGASRRHVSTAKCRAIGVAPRKM